MKKLGALLVVLLVVAAVIIVGCARPAPTPTPSPKPPAPAPSPPAPAPSPVAPKPSPPPAAPAVKEIVVCTISGLTGASAGIHLMCDAGWKDYIRYVNEKKGGFKGTKGTVTVKNISYDSEYKADKAKEMFARAKAAGAIAHSHCASGHSDALMADYEAAKIPAITGSIGVSSTWSDWAYTADHAGTQNMGRTYVKWRYDLWVKAGKPGGKLVLSALMADVPFVPLILYEIEDYCKKLDPKIEMYVELFPPAATDVTALALRLKEKGIESNFGACPAACAIVWFKSFRRAGVDPWKTPLIMPVCSGIDDAVALAGAEAMDGVMWEGYFFPNKHTPDIPEPEGLKIGRWMWENWHKGEGPYRDDYTMGMGSAFVLEEAIRLALDEITPDQLTGENLKKYGLDRIKNFDCLGTTAPFSYTPGDHMGPKRVIYWQLKKGSLINYSGWVESTRDKIPLKK